MTAKTRPESASDRESRTESGDRITVAFLGPSGSFSHETAVQRFADRAHVLLPCRTIHDAFESVRAERADCGVVPVESLRQGPVIETYMELKKAGPCRIVGEAYLPVQLYLLVNPATSLEGVSSVRSKPEALRQCGVWLSDQQSQRKSAGLPEWEIEDSSSTAAAAAYAAEHEGVAAIASRFATEFHDVRAIGRGEPGHDGIQDLPDGASYTRFLILGRSSPSRAEYGPIRIKTSFRFILSHRTGALVDALMPFRSAGISLEEIQPMPYRATRRQIEYVFFMDFLGHIADDSMIRAVREAEETCAIEYLGSYLCSEMPQAVLGPSE